MKIIIVKTNTFIASLIIVIWGNVVLASEKIVFSDLSNSLEKADLIKSKDPIKFKSIMLDLSHKTKLFSGYQLCYFQYLQGYALGFEGNYSVMVEHLDDLFNECDDLDNKARIKLTLANIHVISREYEEAFIDLAFVTENIENIEEPTIRAKTYSIAAIVYRLSGQFDEAIQFSEQLINQNFSPDHVCKGHYNKLRVLMESDYSEDLLKNVKDAIIFCRETENHIESLFLQLDLVKQQVNFFAEDPDQINHLYSELISLENDINMTQYHNLIVYYKSIMAVTAWYAGHPDVARELGVSSLSLNDSLGNTSQKAFVLDMLIFDAIQRADYELGYEYLSIKYQVDREVFDLKSAQSLAFFRVKHANQARNFELRQLKQKNNVLKLGQELSKEKSKKQQLMMLLILSLLLFLGLWTYKIKRKHDYFKHVSEIDHLTQVFTRKAFEEKIKEMINVSETKNQQINLAIMDLDHFKSVNDQYGHLVGDWVLKQVIKDCEEVIDQDTLIARLGGEEFVVVTPGISLDETVVLLEKMRVAIEKLDCSPSGQDFSVTASFGVTSSLVSGLNSPVLLTHADVALFQAKNNGRNQVVIFEG